LAVVIIISTDVGAGSIHWRREPGGGGVVDGGGVDEEVFERGEEGKRGLGRGEALDVEIARVNATGVDEGVGFATVAEVEV
jgi:hypothetical protein